MSPIQISQGDKNELVDVARADPNDPTGFTEKPIQTPETVELDEWAGSPQNPLNWSPVRRWLILVALAIVNLVAAMTTAFEPALNKMMDDFGSDDDRLASLTISIYTLGYCIGPLLVAPTSEVYGRIWLLRVAFIIFPLSLVMCASSKSLALFIVFRAVMGFAGIVFVLLFPAMVPDLFSKDKSGFALSLVSSGPSLGPTLGPIMGGFIAERTNWRWILWACAIAVGAFSLPVFLFLRETYGPVLQRRHLADGDKTSEHQTHQSRRQRWISIYKGPWVLPVRMLIHSPIVLLFAVYTSIRQAYLLLVLATLGLVFEKQYHFSPAESGMAYLGMTVGFLLSQLTLGYLSDVYSSRMKSRHGEHKPEYRLPPLVVGGLVIPAGLFCYGWGVHTHWVVPILGSAVFAIGLTLTYLPINMYLIDCFPKHAASAIGACTVVRSACSAVLPIAADPLYSHLGYDWGNSLLAFIALAFVPIALVLTKYGEKIRLRFEFHIT